MSSPIALIKTQHISAGFTEISERGRGYLKSHRPGTDQYILDVQAGGRGWHFGAEPFTEASEVDTAWQASGGAWDWEMLKADYHAYIRDSVPVSYRYENEQTGQYIEITVDAPLWVNDENDSEQVASFSQVTPSIVDDLITWQSIATGWSVSVQAHPARLSKYIEIDSIANLGAPTIGGTNERLRLEFTYTKSNDLDIYVNGVQWNEQNNTSIETAGNIEFRDSTSGEAIFWIKNPEARDSAKGIAPIIQRLRRTGINFYAEIDIPWTWLQTAAYPITIDPTIDPEPGASNEDAQEDVGGGMNLTSTAINVFLAGVPYGGVYVEPTVPQGATIDVAYIRLYFNSYFDVEASIDLEDSDDAPVFGTGFFDITNRTLTDNAVSWSETTSSGYHNSPSLVTPVQAVVNRGSWSSGAGMVVVIEGVSGSDFQWYTYDNGSNAEILHIEYSTTAADLEPSISDGISAIGESIAPDIQLNAPVEYDDLNYQRSGVVIS